MHSDRLKPLRHAGAMAFAAVLTFAGLQTAAASETGPVIVVPGRSDVPVMLNGNDVSGAVVEGDWGLGRPGNINPTVIYRLGPPALIGPAAPYYPYTGRPPRYGRKEIEPPPNRLLPPPAEDYHREWGGQSQMQAPATIPPEYPPPVIMAPQQQRRRQAAQPHAQPPAPQPHP